MSEYIYASGKSIRVMNTRYGTYTAEYARYTKLPMYGGIGLAKIDYEKVKDLYLSKTRCEKIGMPVKENENPIAWYRVMNGYIPLYERNKR